LHRSGSKTGIDRQYKKFKKAEAEKGIKNEGS